MPSLHLCCVVVVLALLLFTTTRHHGAIAFAAGGSFLDTSDIDATKASSSSRPSLSHLVSSPERYANALNMSIQTVVELKKTHIEASTALSRELATNKTTLSGTEKHALRCQHRYKYGQHPFVCPNCWSYLPVCLCSTTKINEQKYRLAEPVKVIVWTHHREWGLTSNTGCLLPMTLSPCQMFMKGLPEHDKQLEDLLQAEGVLPVVLWPSGNTSGATAQEQSDENFVSTITLPQIRRELRDARQHGRTIVLLAVEGTWRNARRMVNRLPRNVARFDLPEMVVFPASAQRTPAVSILSPLRRQGSSGQDGGGWSSGRRRVCTGEAVVRALVAMECLPEKEGECILEAVRTKVDFIRRYRGKGVV